MDEAEYIKTRAQREPILQEILEGYVPRRIDQLRERLPLEIFSSSLEEPPLPKRRDRFVNMLNGLENSLLEGGCQPFETFRFGYRNLREIEYMAYRDMRKPHYMRVITEVPPDLAKKAMEINQRNPHYCAQYNPDFPENWGVRLEGWEGLAHPMIFRKLFMLTREFLDGMYDHLRSYIPD